MHFNTGTPQIDHKKLRHPFLSKSHTSRFSTPTLISQKCETVTGIRIKSDQQFWMDWGSLQSKARQNHVVLKILKINKNTKHR